MLTVDLPPPGSNLYELSPQKRRLVTRPPVGAIFLGYTSLGVLVWGVCPFFSKMAVLGPNLSEFHWNRGGESLLSISSLAVMSILALIMLNPLLHWVTRFLQ
jgi:hypothetical protein